MMYQHGGDIYSHPGYLDFSANINFLGPPISVIEAVQAAVPKMLHYPQAGNQRLCRAIAKLEQVGEEQVICGNGAAEVIFSLVFAERPKKALIFAPSFQEYEQALRSTGCEIVYEYLRPEDNFQLKEIPAKLDDSIDMAFFCNPNNPTGILTEEIMMKKLLERCKETETLLAVDECFMDFVPMDGQRHASVKKFLKDSDHLVLIKAFTKSFAVPGLRLGYGISRNAGILKRMKAVTQPWNVSVLAQEAGIAAAEEGFFLEKTRRAVTEEKQFLLEQLAFLEDKKNFFIDIYGHAANFIFFRSVSELGQELIKDKILIRDCSNFPGLCEGWYRLAVRSRSENECFIESLKRIEYLKAEEENE